MTFSDVQIVKLISRTHPQYFELLKIIPSICTGTYFNERLNQHWFGQAFRSIEHLTRVIENQPYLENSYNYGFLRGNMNMTRKKL